VRCATCYRNLDDPEQHRFSGYGFLLAFCVECCPGEFDGMPCRHEVHAKAEAQEARRVAMADFLR
jgi:hypothetical protein